MTVEIARSESAEQGVRNASFEARDVTRWNPEESFDFVYARFLLTHLTRPADCSPWCADAFGRAA
ncbi:MAG TPA: class I SAM-dependent methyltransferase [Thermoanaerobaculia bacterium]|nr:class I SAM-dependent methyltransferase [Thermoanaerobaculia bacterium]